jgi:hypothetical protein
MSRLLKEKVADESSLMKSADDFRILGKGLAGGVSAGCGRM